jgi:hypothetical protein
MFGFSGDKVTPIIIYYVESFVGDSSQRQSEFHYNVTLCLAYIIIPAAKFHLLTIILTK